MPRAQANPDPLVEEYAPAGPAFQLRAFRTGRCEVWRDGLLVQVLADPLFTAGGFSRNRYPSNRMQKEALERGKAWVNGAAGGV